MMNIQLVKLSQNVGNVFTRYTVPIKPHDKRGYKRQQMQVQPKDGKNQGWSIEVQPVLIYTFGRAPDFRPICFRPTFFIQSYKVRLALDENRLDENKLDEKWVQHLWYIRSCRVRVSQLMTHLTNLISMCILQLYIQISD